MITVAMNEYLIDIDVAQFVPYVEWAELARNPSCPWWRRSVNPATW